MDAINPYNAPKSHELDAKRDFPDGTGTFELGQCLRDAWHAATTHVGHVVGLSFACIALLALLSLTLPLVLVSPGVAGVYGFVIYFLITPPLVWGATVLLAQIHDERADFSSLLSGFSCYTKSLPRMIVLFIAITLIGLPGGALSLYVDHVSDLVPGTTDHLVMSLLGILVSFVWSLLVMVRFYFGLLFAVDTDLPALTSLGDSLRLSNGNWVKLALLLLLTIIVVLAGLLALGVGLLFAVPLAYLMWVSAFRQAVGRPRS